MADRAESADERALRRELQELTKKREALDTSSAASALCCGVAVRRGAASLRRDLCANCVCASPPIAERRDSRPAAGGAPGRRSVFARLGAEPTRTGGAARQVQLKENNGRGNASWRLGKRDSDRNDADSQQSSAAKRQRLHSAVARPEGGHHGGGRAETARTSNTATSPSANYARTQERKQRAVAPYQQKEGIARSRRMFGALMGHLGKAKRQIEKDTDLFKRQDTKQQEAEQREKMQSQDLEKRARQDAEISKLEAQIARTELDHSEQVARAKLEHLQKLRKSSSQSKFLVTIASPPIYYLPAKHTKETEDLVAASMEAHEAKTKASAQSHEENLRKLEAEFTTKLEQLRERLEVVKSGGKEKGSRNEKEKKTRNNDDDDDDEMDRDRKGPESDSADEHDDGDEDMPESRDEARHESPPKASGMEGEDEDIVQESVSGSEAGSSSAAEASKDNDGKDGGDAEVKSDLKRENEKKRSASPSKAMSDEAEQASRSKQGEGEKVTKDTGAKPTSSLNATTTAEEGSPKKEDATAKTEAPVEPKPDPTADVDKMKVTELRAELKKRGLDTKGLKAKLVQRLKDVMHEDDESK
ncbi:unnamed protein product [Phytophthora lilii]|uniref:Unnamed protein product n=1 Tax=Phytophthora lilii TaxID=2077276 RepID=A0A9W6TGR4_9STRA|nr:unnamed protein product [Phytophthora lilii]